MSIHALMQEMAAAGAPLEAIMIAVKAIEDAQHAVADQRAVARDRKRRQRDREREAVVETDEERDRDCHVTVTGQSRVEDVTEDDSPPLPKTPQTPQLPTPPDNNSRARKGGSTKPLPDWMPAAAWQGFVEMRRAMPKVPFTPRAQQMVIKKLAEFRGDGQDIEKILDRSVSNGWRDVFAIKLEGNSGKPNSPKSSNNEPKTADDFERAARFRDTIGDIAVAEEYRQKAAELRAAPEQVPA